MQTYPPPTTLPRLAMAERHSPIHYDDGGAQDYCIAYPINYNELYDLRSRLFTIIDATFIDPEQRKAHKDIVWQALRVWMHGVEHAAEQGSPDS